VEDNNDAENLIRPSRNGRSELLLLALVFLMLSVVFTRNVALFIADGTPCGGGDSAMFAWNFWWVAEQIKHGDLFFNCDWAMIPFGIRTIYHTTIPLHCAALAPITWLWGPIVSSNLSLILSFALGALGMAVLVRFLTGSHLAGLCAGIAFAFSTTHWYHAIGHYNLTATELLPFCLYFLLKWTKNHRQFDLVMAAALLALNLYNDYTTTIILGLCAAPIFVLGLVRTARSRGKKKSLLALSLAAVVFCVIASPVIYYASEFSSLFDADWGRDTGLAVRSSADAFSYFVPDSLVWFASERLKQGWPSRITGGGLDRPQFFGVFALLLLCLGAFSLRKKDKGLLVCLLVGLLVCLAISLGPKPKAFGVQFIPAALSPFTLLTSLPLLADLRIPGRFGLGVALAGAILVGFGAARLFSKQRSKEATAILTVLVAGLLFAERVHVPITTNRTRLPSVYNAIGTLSPKPRGILITPFQVWSGQGMVGTFPFVDPSIMLLYQTVHKTPMANGYASRIPREITSYYRQAPLLSSLMALQTGRGIDLDRILSERDYVEQITSLLGLTHIVCDYRANYWAGGYPMKRYIEDVLGAKMVYQDRTGRIYRLPLTDKPARRLVITPDEPSARLYLMEGWQNPITYSGRKRIIFDPCRRRAGSSRAPRLRVIFRNCTSSNELHYVCQFTPVFPARFKMTHFRIDLDGNAIPNDQISEDDRTLVRGALDSELLPGLHYLTLAPNHDVEEDSQPDSLSDQAMFIESIELRW